MGRIRWVVVLVLVVAGALVLGGCCPLLDGLASDDPIDDVIPPPPGEGATGGDEGGMLGGSLVNPGFEDGLSGWTVYDQKPEGSPGTNVIETTPWQERGGNIGGGNPEWFPEGGAQVRVFYTDEEGNAAEWYHGMCMVPTSGLDPNFEQIPDNQWTPFTSANLMELDPKPARIDTVRFYGFGWGFDAMFDDCNLMIEAFE